MWSSINFIKHNFLFSLSSQTLNSGGTSTSSKPNSLGIWYLIETKKDFFTAILSFLAGIAFGSDSITFFAESLNRFLARFSDSLSKKLTPTTLEFGITLVILPLTSMSNFTLTIASISLSHACFG